MNRIVETLYHFLIWLGRSIGLVKRPLPIPPQTPPPTFDDGVPITTEPLVFYGPFIPQWGSFEFRERVLFDFSYQVHGCGSTMRKYGIKNPIKNKIMFSLGISCAETGKIETVFNSQGFPIPNVGACVDRLYWIPGDATLMYPRSVEKAKRRPFCLTVNPPPAPQFSSKTTTYQISLMAQAPNGQEWFWDTEVEVVGNSCW